MGLRPKKLAGFTLMEVVMMILIVSVLGVLGVSNFDLTPDSLYYEQTRERMGALRVAMIGDERALDAGHRNNFGYVGDWGSLPAALGNLNVAQAPAWTFDNTVGFGAGWKGPYVADAVFGGVAVTLDAWGNALVYNPGAVPPSLTSLGADGAVGGTLLNTDLVTQIPTNLWRGTVRGFVLDGEVRVVGATVEMSYPVNGVVTSVNMVTGALGEFAFAGVPFGRRAIAVTSAPGIAARTVLVDSADVELPKETLNYYGARRAVSYVAASRAQGGLGGLSNVYVTLSSNYSQPLQVATMKIDWQANAPRLYSVIVNGVVHPIAIPYPASPTVRTFTEMAVIQPNSSNTLELDFSNKNNAMQATDVTKNGGGVTVDFTWANSASTDSVAF